jgi:hypothetical protein
MAAASTDQNFTEELGAIEQCRFFSSSCMIANDQGSECCPKPKGPQLYTRSSSIRPQSRSDSFLPFSSTCLNQIPLPPYSLPTQTAHSLDWPLKWISFLPLNHPRLAEETGLLVLPVGATWTTQQKSGLDRTGFRLPVLFSPMIDGEVDTILTRF